MKALELLPMPIESEVDRGESERAFLSALAKAKLTPRGATFLDELSESEWKLIGSRMALFQDDLHFMIGDWLNFGRGRMKHWRRCTDVAAERYAFAFAATAIPFKTLAQIAWVCRKVRRRYLGLHWSHHVELASMNAAEQRSFAKLTEKNNWSVSQMRIKRRLKLQNCSTESGSPTLDLPLWIFDCERWLASQHFASWSNERRLAWRQRLNPLVQQIRSAWPEND